MNCPRFWILTLGTAAAIAVGWPVVGHATGPEEDAKEAALEEGLEVVAPQAAAAKKAAEAAKRAADLAKKAENALDPGGRSKKNKTDLCRAAKDRHYYLERKTRLKDPVFRKKKVKKCRRQHRRSKSWCKRKVHRDKVRYKKGFHDANVNYWRSLEDMRSYYTGPTDPETVFKIYNGRSCENL